MNEPRRWLDDPNAPAGLRELLQDAPRGRSLDGVTRARLGHRVSRFAAIPLTAAAWLSVKSAAALGIAAGVATAGVVAVVERSVLAPTPTEHASEPTPKPARISAPPRAREPAPELAPPAPTSTELEPTAQAPLEAPRVAPPAAVAAASPPTAPSGGLAEESRLLEQARRALGSDPRNALELTREHARRFPRAALGAERNLLEIEALYRNGERGQARALAERLLARSSDDLYAERVRRLLAKIELGQ